MEAVTAAGVDQLTGWAEALGITGSASNLINNTGDDQNYKAEECGHEAF